MRDMLAVFGANQFGAILNGSLHKRYLSPTPWNEMKKGIIRTRHSEVT